MATTRRTFSKMLVSLLPAAWVVSRVKADSEPAMTAKWVPIQPKPQPRPPMPDYYREVTAFGDFGPHTLCIATMSDGSIRHCTIGDLGKCTVGTMTCYGDIPDPTAVEV